MYYNLIFIKMAIEGRGPLWKTTFNRRFWANTGCLFMNATTVFYGKSYSKAPYELRFWKRIIQMSVLFCKYRHNQSSVLYEIWNLAHKIVKNNQKKFHTDPCMHTCIWGINMRAHRNGLCTRMWARIFMKLFIVVPYYFISLSLKLYKDPSFVCWDICKTILMFV